MHDTDRRQFLRATAGLAAVGAAGGTAGCLDSVPFVGDSSAAMDAVPADADAVVYADLDVVREDEGVRTLTNTYLEQQAQYEYYDGPEDFEELLGDIEDESDIDPANVHEATAFSAFGGEEYDLFDTEYWGVVVRADLTAEDFRDSFEEVGSIDFEEAEHSGSVVYEPEEEGGLYVGALSADGAVVVGTEDGVYDAIDVDNGDEDPADEELRGAYTSTRDAPFRFASRMPSPSDNEAVPEGETSGDGDSYDFTVFDDVTTVAGSVYRDGSVRGLAATLAATDGDTAEDVADLLGDLQSDIEEDIYDETIAELVGDISISRDGSDVTASLEKEISELESLIEDAYDEPDEPRSTTPQASFEFEYDEASSATGDFDGTLASGDTTGLLTITHEGGDTIDAAQLTLTDEDGGSTESYASAAGLSTVSAGTSVNVRVDSDDTIRLIWTDDSGDSSTTLAAWEGPDA